MTPIIDDLRSRGHWKVVIRPESFDQARVPYLELEPIIEQAAVHLRGWDFPHIDRHEQVHRELDWIGQTSAWEHHLETWRFYTSGLVAVISGMSIDWRDRSSFWPADADWASGARLGVLDALYRYTEVFELAARLALSPAGDDVMHIEVTAAGLSGRELYVDSHDRAPFFQPYHATLAELPYSVGVTREELVAGPRELAIAPALELFQRFGWETTPELLKEAQKELR